MSEMVEKRQGAAFGREELRVCPLVVFDCDGVILDSNGIKTDGFARAVATYPPESIDAFLAFHQENGGMSRYLKFEHFFRDIIGLENYAADLSEALAVYSASIHSAMLECPTVSGIEEVLGLLRDAEVPCFVVSGSDQRELRDILAYRELAQFFRGIYGSPASKRELVAEICRRLGGARGGAFFGDALIDMETAIEFGLTPIFVSRHSIWANGSQVCGERGWSQIGDFRELE